MVIRCAGVGRWLIVLTAWLAFGASGLQLPDVLSDHMVLQRERAVPIWGKAGPEAQISVSFAGEVATTTADDVGNWRIDISTGAASSDGRTLTIAEAGGETIELTDVLVGEVWHASGQSNMRWTMSRLDHLKPEIAAAEHPEIRVFMHPHTAADAPRFSNGGEWRVCSPETAGDFSAVGYFFGRELNAELDVPVGLVVTPWGGASAEAYVTPESLATLPGSAEYAERIAQRRAQAQADADAAGEELVNNSPRLRGARIQNVPSVLYHGMIEPVAPFAKRGAIWYQGESNASRAEGYDELMRLLIEDWRSRWNQPDEHREFPFLAVQLANFRAPIADPNEEGWGPVRQAQLDTATHHPRTYLATAVDVGEADDIHPRNKQEVGRRLALIALRRVYGIDGLIDQGPTFVAGEPLEPDGVGRARMHLRFDHAAGLATKDGEAPRGFAVRASDSDNWQWAQVAAVDGDAVLVTAPAGVVAPFDVRYGWGNNPTDGPHGINLINSAGLPAFPFQALVE